MAILFQDELTGLNEGAFTYIKTDCAYTFSSDGMRCKRTVGGDYTGGGVFTKRRFIMKEGFTVQVDVSKIDNNSALFAFSGIRVQPETSPGGSGQSYGFSWAVADISTISADISSSFVVGNPLTFEQAYTVKYTLQKGSSGFEFAYSLDGTPVPGAVVPYAPIHGSPFISDSVVLQLGAGFYSSAAVRYKNLIISSTPFETPETTTSFDPLMKEHYV